MMWGVSDLSIFSRLTPEGWLYVENSKNLLERRCKIVNVKEKTRENEISGFVSSVMGEMG